MNNIEEIKKGTYEGYYWMSDEQFPRVLVNEPLLRELDETKNPFVIEAQLFDESRHVSFSIKYVDGDYIVKDFLVTQEELSGETEYFLPNKMGEDVKCLKFLQRWEADKDELCEGIAVLKPGAFVFIGFEFKDKERK